MGRLNEKYKYQISPKAKESAIIKGDKYRFMRMMERVLNIKMVHLLKLNLN